MTTIKQLHFICRSVVQIAFFYVLMLFWGYLVDPLILELYLNTPFVLFACTSFFLFLFFCRMTACLLFMPKDKLKAVLRDGQDSLTASQTVIRLFSWPFIKRVSLFFLLFVAEFALRLACIPLFLKTVGLTVPLWARLSSVSAPLTDALLFAVGYIVLELPSFLLFYKLSFKGRAGRSAEYRFGMKSAAFVLTLLGLRIALLYLETRYPFKHAGIVSSGVLAAFGIGLWYLMYRKERSFRPFCSKITGFFGKFRRCRQKKEREELQKSYEEAAKIAETIIEAASRDVTPPANGNDTEENRGQ